MNLMLRRSVEVLAVTVLLVAMLAVLPAAAEAQETTASTHDARSPIRGADTAPARVVVRPGDTLWAISEERLGPDATPRRIANEVQRIYALNRRRIGDPDLIFAGQKLLLPPMEPSEDGPSSAATLAREATEPVTSHPADRAAKSETERAAGMADDKTEPAQTPTRDPNSEKASRTPRDTGANPVVLPDLPTKELTPEADSLATKETSPTTVVSSVSRAMSGVVDWAATSLHKIRYDEGRLFGLGFFAIAFGAALGLVVRVARALRERRRVERRTSQLVYGKIKPRSVVGNRSRVATVAPEPVRRSTEDLGPKSVRETKADGPSPGAKDPAPKVRHGHEA